MKKKLLAVVLTAAMTLTCLAGCGKQEAATGGDTSNATEGTKTEASADGYVIPSTSLETSFLILSGCVAFGS